MSRVQISPGPVLIDKMPQRSSLITGIGTERMLRLLELARERTIRDKSSDPLSKRYIKIAREISSHYKISSPREFKNSVCKKCNSVLIPGLNCKVRLASGKKYLVYKCECGKEKHVFYK